MLVENTPAAGLAVIQLGSITPQTARRHGLLAPSKHWACSQLGGWSLAEFLLDRCNGASLQFAAGGVAGLQVHDSLAAQDPEVHRLTAEVSQLLKPQAALREPALAARVMSLM